MISGIRDLMPPTVESQATFVGVRVMGVSGHPNVKALGYIAAYALDEGESVAAVNELGGHTEESLLLDNSIPRPFPGAVPGDAGHPDVTTDLILQAATSP